MKSLIDSELLPNIPNKIKTFWGQTYNPNEEVWSFDDIGVRTKIDFSKYKNGYLKFTAKLFLSTLSYSKSLSHIINFERQISILADIRAFSKLEESIKEKVDLALAKNRNTHHDYLSWYIKTWYIWCSDLDLQYFDYEYSSSLENIAISGNVKGQAVLSLEEDEGPFSEMELSEIIKLLGKDKKDSKGRILTYLFLTLGCNPRNLILLQWTDFSVIEEGDYKFYLLNVPRIKKRRVARGEFKTRELDQRIGQILEKFKKFKNSNYIFATKDGRPYSTLILSEILLNYLSALIKDTKISGLKITPRRFRYTFATRLVMSGVSKERLADLLDHTDLQHVQVYYDLRHKIKGFLSEAESKEMGEIFGKFEGTINSKSDKFKKDIKYYLKDTTAPVGNCGSNSLCELNAPYSCFVCSKFNAFEDSLSWYEKILKDLTEWKDQRWEKHDENDRIQSQMDSVISALKDLISRIKKESK